MKQDCCLDFTRKRKHVGVVMRSTTPIFYSSPSMDGGCRFSCGCQIQTQGTLQPPKEAHKQRNCAHPCWKRQSQERCMPSYEASMRYPSRLNLLPCARPGARFHGEKEIQKKCSRRGKKTLNREKQKPEVKNKNNCCLQRRPSGSEEQKTKKASTNLAANNHSTFVVFRQDARRHRGMCPHFPCYAGYVTRILNLSHALRPLACVL
jgi:hypothetical protein